MECKNLLARQREVKSSSFSISKGDFLDPLSNSTPTPTATRFEVTSTKKSPDIVDELCNRLTATFTNAICIAPIINTATIVAAQLINDAQMSGTVLETARPFVETQKGIGTTRTPNEADATIQFIPKAAESFIGPNHKPELANQPTYASKNTKVEPSQPTFGIVMKVFLFYQYVNSLRWPTGR